VVAGDEVVVLLLVIEGKGEDPVKFIEESGPFFPVEGKDHFAVGVGAERVAACEGLSQCLVVVDLPVDGQHQPAVVTEEGLAPRGRVDNGKPLVRHHGFLSAVDPRPVGAPVADSSRHGEDLRPQGSGRHARLKCTYYSAHNIWIVALIQN